MAESIEQFMERRRRELALSPEAEAAGYNMWAASTRSGENVAAPRPQDVRALGGQVPAQQRPPAASPARTRGPSPASQSTPRNSGVRASAPAMSPLAARMYMPPPDEVARLRREQAEFKKTEREVSRQNQWMAVPALAPAAVVLALEAGAAFAASRVAPQATRTVLNFAKRDRYLRSGENVTTRAGRRAHKVLEERLKQKPGWEYEPKVHGPNGLRKPDVGAPARNPAKPTERYQMEYKPNTPSGRRAGERAARKYEKETGNRTRPIYYNPKDYM